VVFGLSHALVAAGYLRHALRTTGTMEGKESWVKVLYPFGLIFLILVGWTIAVFGQAGGLTSGVWWASVSSTLLAAGLWFFTSRRQTFDDNSEEGRGWFAILAKRAAPWVSSIFSLNWIYRGISALYRFLQILISFLSLLLEGQGGVLWALVLLALLSTLIASGGV
jgi:hypothetical protein